MFGRDERHGIRVGCEHVDRPFAASFHMRLRQAPVAVEHPFDHGVDAALQLVRRGRQRPSVPEDGGVAEREQHAVAVQPDEPNARHGGVDERLVLEEVRMPPHTFSRVMQRTGGPGATGLGAMEARAGPEDDRDVRFPLAVARVPEIQGPDFSRLLQLQCGGEQARGIHASNLPAGITPHHNHPSQTAKGRK